MVFTMEMRSPRVHMLALSVERIRQENENEDEAIALATRNSIEDLVKVHVIH